MPDVPKSDGRCRMSDRNASASRSDAGSRSLHGPAGPARRGRRPALAQIAQTVARFGKTRFEHRSERIGVAKRGAISRSWHRPLRPHHDTRRPSIGLRRAPHDLAESLGGHRAPVRQTSPSRRDPAGRDALSAALLEASGVWTAPPPLARPHPPAPHLVTSGEPGPVSPPPRPARPGPHHPLVTEGTFPSHHLGGNAPVAHQPGDGRPVVLLRLAVALSVRDRQPAGIASVPGFLRPYEIGSPLLEREGQGRVCRGRPPSHPDRPLPSPASQIYGCSRPMRRGNGIASRRWPRPQTHATVRSSPSPKPACGTDP